MISKSICFGGEIVKKLSEQAQSTVILSEEYNYEKFVQTLRINSQKREFNAKLPPPPTLVTRFVHSVNVSTNAIKGSDISD